MEKYQFEDFKVDEDNTSIIQDGKYGMKIEISLFNDLVPKSYRDKALDILNEFICSNSDIKVTSTDSLAVMLEAYIDENVDIYKKYWIVIYFWNEDVQCTKDYIIEIPIQPTEEKFLEFQECVMKELEKMIF